MIFIRLAVILALLIALFNNNFILIKKFFLSSLNIDREMEELQKNNDYLKAELFICENLSGHTEVENKWEYFSVKNYSSYPFNNQNLIGLNAGEEVGVKTGQAVVVAPALLLGQVIKVNQAGALVRTVFDNDFVAVVKIGENKVNALLKGGVPPTLEMIEKNKDIKNGEIVYNADPNYPYGFKWGEVQTLENNQTGTAGLFRKAFLKSTYNTDVLEDVFIVRNFEVIKNN